MANPYEDKAAASRAQKMREMGVTPGPTPAARARSFAPLVPAEQGDPKGAIREGKILSRNPIEAVRQIYTPETIQAIPPRTEQFKED